MGVELTEMLRSSSSRLSKLTKSQLKMYNEFLRVNHAGEFGANQIYAGQHKVLKNTSDGPLIQHISKTFSSPNTKLNILPFFRYGELVRMQWATRQLKWERTQPWLVQKLLKPRSLSTTTISLDSF